MSPTIERQYLPDEWSGSIWAVMPGVRLLANENGAPCAEDEAAHIEPTVVCPVNRPVTYRLADPL